jgi:maltose-binding protein MalE
LDEFLDKDEETQYINATMLDGFHYEGKTYAVPAWLQFTCIVVNLDLAEQLNLEKPGYDWSIDEFLSMARAATTNQTSGINHVQSLDQYLMMQLQESGGQWGYHPETHTHDLTSGAFEEAQAIVNDLAKVPQLVADNMRDADLVAAGGMDDYSSKYGANADALAEGKLLFANQSTWDDEWLNTTLTGFNWDFYPVPAREKGEGKQIVHADYGFMLSTAEYPDAAWELLKFISFGRDGLLVRMGLQEENAGGMYANNRFTIPVSSHPDVVAAFTQSAKVPEGVKYMYNNMDKSVKADYSKVLPDYWVTVNDNIYSAIVRIRDGEEPSAVARETEEKINKEFGAVQQTFATQMQQVQKDFEALRG